MIFACIKFYQTRWRSWLKHRATSQKVAGIFTAGKGGRCWQPYHLHLGASTFWNPQGLSRHVMGLLCFLSSTRHTQILGSRRTFVLTDQRPYQRLILLLFFVTTFFCSVNCHYRHTSEADVSHQISLPPTCLCLIAGPTSIMGNFMWMLTASSPDLQTLADLRDFETFSFRLTQF
jgi:hypothetical protein